MLLYNREIKEKIERLVDSEGIFNFGTFNNPIENINMLDAHKPLNLKLPKFIKNYKLKEWEAFQAGNDDFFIIGAIYNAKAIALNILTVYDRKNNKFYNYRKFCKPSSQIIGNGLIDSITKYESKNHKFIYYNNLNEGKITIDIDIKNKSAIHEFKLNIIAYHNTEPIVICQPFDKNRALYSHKALMPMEGSMIIGDKKTEFNIDNSFTIIDDHKGYYPKTVKYDWVTGYCYYEKYGLIGFNLTDNQIINHEKYNENCIWIDGKMHILPPVKFERTYNNKEVWNITDKYDMLNIRFYPQKKYSIKFNAFFIYLDYESPFGNFEGYIKTNSGTKVNINDFFGIGEKKTYRL